MIGQRAPDFALQANDGKIYALKDLAGRKIVLVFYVMNNTPG
jgi:peroxiredoxin